MSIDLGRLLIDAGVVARAEVEAALFISVVRGIPFPRALVDRGAISERALEAELDRRGGLALQQVIGSRELFARLPREICRRLGAVPTRLDPASGTVDVAAADPLDRHVAAELSVHLGMPVRVLRAPMAAIEEAIRALELGGRPAPLAPRWRRATPAFPFGAPQSTIPPPPAEQPIPLVRRVVAPASGDEAEIALPLLRQTRPAAVEGPATLRGPLRHPGLRPDQPDHAPGPHGDAPPTLRGAVLPTGPSSGRWREPGRVVAPVEIEVVSPPSPSLAAPGSGQPEPAAPATPQAPSTLPQGRRLLLARSEQPAESLPPTVPGESDGGEPAPFADLGEILGAIHGARSRDEIVALSLRGLRLLARRAALFAVKRGMFLGYACTPELGDQAALREVAIPTGQPSILATATATGVYLGPVPGTPAHAPLLAVMGSAGPDVAAVAIRVAGRPVLVLFADELGDTMIGTRSMDELARAVGDALTRILAARM